MNWTEAIMLTTLALAIIGGITCIRFVWPIFILLFIAIFSPLAAVGVAAIVGAMAVIAVVWELFLAPALVGIIQCLIRLWDDARFRILYLLGR